MLITCERKSSLTFINRSWTTKQWIEGCVPLVRLRWNFTRELTIWRSTLFLMELICVIRSLLAAMFSHVLYLSTIVDVDSFISLACVLYYSFYGFDFFVLLLGSAPIGGLNLFVADFSAGCFLSWVLWVISSTSLVSRRPSTLIVVTAIVGIGKTIVSLLSNLFNCHGGLWSSEVKCCCSCWNILYSHWAEQKMAPDLLLHNFAYLSNCNINLIIYQTAFSIWLSI